MKSLLGQFYNRIIGSQEDIASESLAYILKNSKGARMTIRQIVNLDTGLSFPDLYYSVQNVGIELERPDISGKDVYGKELLLIEAKFWASLTSNQPMGYLKRLGNKTVLMFLVPALRIPSIFNEVLRIIRENYSEIDIDIENHIIKIRNTNQYIVLKNWNSILTSIKLKLTTENDPTLISDIDQVIGFVDIVDKNSFQPISNNDLSPSIPKKISSYFNIVDKVVDELKIRIEKVNTQNLTNGQSKNYYRRYFVFGCFGCGFGYILEHWMEYADTPFWLSIKTIENSKWTSLSIDFRNKCKTIAFELNLQYIEKGDETFLSLYPLLHQTEELVIDDFINKIESVYKMLINKDIY